jgi:type III pantothenate kinase
MNLAIDLGNTFAKTGVFVDGKLQDLRKGLDYPTLLEYIDSIKPKHIVVSTVSYSEEQLKADLGKYDPDLILLQPDTLVPLVKLYDTPHTLGRSGSCCCWCYSIVSTTKLCCDRFGNV